MLGRRIYVRIYERIPFLRRVVADLKANSPEGQARCMKLFVLDC